MSDAQTTPRGQVTELQKFLTDYYDLNPADYVTGSFGRLTYNNVVKLQREQALPAYGIVGSLTRAAIARVCAGAGQPTSNVPPANNFPRTGTTSCTLDGITIQ